MYASPVGYTLQPRTDSLSDLGQVYEVSGFEGGLGLEKPTSLSSGLDERRAASAQIDILD